VERSCCFKAAYLFGGSSALDSVCADQYDLKSEVDKVCISSRKLWNNLKSSFSLKWEEKKNHD
jgi:hypothetical protein